MLVLRSKNSVRMVGPGRRPHGGDPLFDILKVHVGMVTFIAEATGQVLLIVADQYIISSKRSSEQRCGFGLFTLTYISTSERT